jgi:Tfp pilus assembly protein PilE
MKRRTPSRREEKMPKRRGFTLLELGAAGIMLVAMLAVCLQFFRAAATQRRALQQRRTALREADNVMERLCARPWEQLTTDQARELPLGEQARSTLSGSERTIEIVQSDEEPAEKRITVQIRWPSGPGRPDQSVRLVAWKYREPNG